MSPVKANNRGFTLIELMVVIAIISLLVALALPSYIDFTVRSKVAEGIHLTAAAKFAVEESCQVDSSVNIQTQSGYSFSQSSYVESVQIQGNCSNILIIVQTRNTGAQGDPIILLSKATSPGLINFLGAIGIPVGVAPSWACFVGGSSRGYAPSNCRWQPQLTT